MPLLGILTLSDCQEKALAPDSKLIDDIWEKIIQISEIDPDTAKPKIDFSNSYAPANQKYLGRYYPENQKIEIYPLQIYGLLWAWREKHPYYSIGYVQGEAFFYSVIAHEMFHYALHIRGETIGQHQIMKDRKYTEQALNFIND